jgi:hypothetical protein
MVATLHHTIVCTRRMNSASISEKFVTLIRFRFQLVSECLQESKCRAEQSLRGTGSATHEINDSLSQAAQDFHARITNQASTEKGIAHLVWSGLATRSDHGSPFDRPNTIAGAFAAATFSV